MIRHGTVFNSPLHENQTERQTIWSQQLANPEDQAAGVAEARDGVKFSGRHGLTEAEISATLPFRTGGRVLVEGPAASAAGFMPKNQVRRAPGNPRESL